MPLLFTCLFLGLLEAGCATDPGENRQLDVEVGRAHFRSYCSACHQYDGHGMGEAPPLDGSPWVMGSQERLIKIVLHGVRGRLEVGGVIYDREMPGVGKVLSDRDLAALLSFVREHFGSSSEAVTPDAVRLVREANRDRTAYWDLDDLR